MSLHVHSPISLAIEQLDIALKLFVQRRPRYAAALTLAGASEEILAKLLESRGELTSQRHWYINKRLNWPRNWPELTWAEHAREENLARNAAKHLLVGTELLIALDLEKATFMMLHRACTNYEWLGFERSWRIRRFDARFLRWSA